MRQPESELTRRSKRWLQAFVVTSGLLLTTQCAVNYVVNPYGYYPPRLLVPIAWSSRRMKVELLQRRPPPAVLVLGSSRAMRLAPADISRRTGWPAFNASVDSARVEDWLALLRFAVESCHAPLREIVLGIDVEAFHNHLEPDPRLVATRQLRPFLPAPMVLRWYASASRDLLSSEQLSDSVRSIRMSRVGYPPPIGRFDDDGLLHGQLDDRPLTDSAATIADYRERFVGFDGLDDGRQATFRALLAYAAAHGIRIRAFVTTLSEPLVADLRNTRDFDRLHGLVRDWLFSLARDPAQFSVVDFTDVSAFGGDPRGFVDAAHVDHSNSRRIVEALYLAQPRAAHALQ